MKVLFVLSTSCKPSSLELSTFFWVFFYSLTHNLSAGLRHPYAQDVWFQEPDPAAGGSTRQCTRRLPGPSCCRSTCKCLWLERLHNSQLTAAQFPGTNYPGSEVPYAVAGAQFNETSPPYYPSPWGTGAGEWASAYEKAIAFVSKLTLAEKVNLTTGTSVRHDTLCSCLANFIQVLGQFNCYWDKRS